MLDFKAEIARRSRRSTFVTIREAYDKREQLRAMSIACDAVILLRGASCRPGRNRGGRRGNPTAGRNCDAIADVCRRVPAHAPRDFHEALQSYWFCHLAVITELNGWDSFSPGHLDQHLLPFYERGLADGTLTRETARELLECFFIKFNNHPRRRRSA